MVGSRKYPAGARVPAAAGAVCVYAAAGVEVGLVVRPEPISAGIRFDVPITIRIAVPIAMVVLSATANQVAGRGVWWVL